MDNSLKIVNFGNDLENDVYVKRIRTFLWYDLETFGRFPYKDRIAQFACIRTDRDLNQIGEPVVLYCKPQYDYLPNVDAILKNGISLKFAAENGIPESEFIERINNIFSEPGTCICGYNSVAFDNEFIRYTLYRNFLDPYKWSWDNSCSVMDVFNLVRACHDVCPDGINWPVNPENGFPVLKLEELTRANGIEHFNAHNAMSDVKATIDVARLIREKHPDLFSYYLKYKFKENSETLVNLRRLGNGNRPEDKTLLYQNYLYASANGISSLIYPLCRDVTDSHAYYFFNLNANLYPLLEIVLKSRSEERVNVEKIPGVEKIKTNKALCLIPEKLLTRDLVYDKLGFNKSVFTQRVKKLEKHMNEIERFFNWQLQDPVKERTASEDLDASLYEGFATDIDKRLFVNVRALPPEKKFSINPAFKDPKYHELFFRYVCRNYPYCAKGENLDKWKKRIRDVFLNGLESNRPDRNENVFNLRDKLDSYISSNECTEKEKMLCLETKEIIEKICAYVGIEV